MTIDEARKQLAEASEEARFDVCIEVVRALDEDAIPLMAPLDWGGAKACIHAQDGTGPLWEVPTFREWYGKRGRGNRSDAGGE